MNADCTSVAEFRQCGRSTQLVVMLHGYCMSPESLRHVRARVHEAMPDADTLAPSLAISRFSFANLDDVSTRIIESIDHYWNKRKDAGEPYERIILVGHSGGALLARKAYLLASNKTLDKRAELPREWAQKVTRIVQLAGMNRGWAISHHMGICKALMMFLGVLIAKPLSFVKRRQAAILQIHRGKPFVTQLRLEWIKLLLSDADAPVTIQLLGTIDDLVSPRDNIDMVSGRKSYYMDVPKSGHVSVIDMDETPEGLQRGEIFSKALTRSVEQLQPDLVTPDDDDQIPQDPDYNVKHVVFVMHGIRDAGYWTHRIARHVTKRYRERHPGTENTRVIATETSSYGYFPILPFILPARRLEKVEWLMEEYVKASARYPNAKFSYIGHSNGTYLLAKALTEYPFASFRHVVFAGSIVHSRYKWTDLRNEKKVEAVLNYRATRDVPVALFPNFYEYTGMKGLGAASHRGFADPIVQQQTVRGGHSAGLKEELWDEMAQFIDQGTVESVRDIQQPFLMRLVAILSTIFWVLILFLVLLVIIMLWPYGHTLKTVALLVVSLTLWIVATKF